MPSSVLISYLTAIIMASELQKTAILNSINNNQEVSGAVNGSFKRSHISVQITDEDHRCPEERQDLLSLTGSFRYADEEGVESCATSHTEVDSQFGSGDTLDSAPSGSSSSDNQAALPVQQRLSYSEQTRYNSRSSLPSKSSADSLSTSGASMKTERTLLASRCQRVAIVVGVVVVIVTVCFLLGYVFYQSRMIEGLKWTNHQLRDRNSCLGKLSSVSDLKCPAPYSPPPGCRVQCKTTC